MIQYHRIKPGHYRSYCRRITIRRVLCKPRPGHGPIGWEIVVDGHSFGAFVTLELAKYWALDHLLELDDYYRSYRDDA